MSTFEEITVEAERSVIGAVMLDPISVIAAGDRVGITPDHFCYAENRILWHTITEMAQAGSQVDTLTVRDELTKRGTLDDAGGFANLSSCMDACQTTAHAEAYFTTVREQWQRRELALAGMELQRESREAPSPSQAVASGMDKLTAIAEVKSAEPSESEIMDENMADIREARRKVLAGEKVEVGIPTGFDAIDRRLNGGAPRGAYVVIGARPSTGKTITEENIAVNAAMRGKRIVRCTVDMTRKRLYKRTACRLCDVSWEDITLGRCRDGDIDRIGAMYEKLKGLDMTTMQLETDADRIISRLRALHAQKPIDAFTVDYLQALKSERRFSKPQERVKYISAAFKGFAQEINATCFMMAQLNRGPEGDNRLPRMSDLRDAGEIEQDAEIGILLSENRDIVIPYPDIERYGRMAINMDIAKQQDGMKGVVPFFRDGARFKMVEASTGWGQA